MTCRDCLIHDICEEKEKLMLTVDNLYELIYQEAVEVSCKHFKNKADVVEVEKVAKILVDVTGIAPCEMVSANEWDYDYCNCAELCSQLNYKQCWERYLKHSKG